MSATLDDKLERNFTEQLAEFEGKLRDQDDNAELLAEIHTAVTDLIAENGGRDDEIREILQKRYNGGKLRLETYTLVRNVLDRVVIESMPTMPDAVDDEPGEDAWTRTTAAESGREDEESGHHRLQVGSVLRDRFLLQERVAGGSMGVVYKALDRRIAEADGVDPWVAIKVLSSKLSRNAHALRALQQEAAKGRCLSHPNIVRFIDLDRDDDIYFLVMEWLDGRSLAAILDDKRNQSLDRATALDIVRQVGLALDYAHRCGVVHADVKPANIMILPSGKVKLFDFGIARIRQKQSPTRREFDPGVLGAVTPAYSSMQVLTGEDPQPSDDVFSLGCLMYRLVAGHRVFGPRNAAEAAEQGMEPQRPHGLSDAQWRALKKAVAYARVSRFETPAEFLDALAADDDVPEPAATLPLHRGPVHAHEAPAHEMHQPFMVEPRPAPPKRRRWGLVLTLLVVLGGVVAIAMRPDLIERAREGVASVTGRLTANTGDDVRTAPEEDLRQEDPMAGNPFAQPAQRVPEDEGETPAGAAGSVPSDGEAGTSPAAASEGEAGTATAGGAGSPGADDEQAAAQDPASGAAAGGTSITPAPGSAPAGNDVTRPLPSYEERAGGQGSVPVGPDTRPAAPSGAAGATADLPPTLTVPIDNARSTRPEFDLTLRENAEAAVVELVRPGGIREPLAVLVEEVSFSGNRSPLTTGRYRLSSHMARFEAGQTSARFTITMSSDNVREADRQATLLVRNAANSASRFALLNLTLQDDDQRMFEASLARDTIGFSQSRLFVSEQSPAVQIDVLRFNPSNTEFAVRYRIVIGGSATEGEDYFVPGTTGLVFGPSQRAARLLIPIVQDSEAEGEESFTLALVPDTAGEPANVNRQITVVIGDDDLPF